MSVTLTDRSAAYRQGKTDALHGAERPRVRPGDVLYLAYMIGWRQGAAKRKDTVK